MNKRNRLMALAAVGVAAAALGGGMLISGSALASSDVAPPDTVEAIVPDPSGTGYFSCTFTDIRSHGTHVDNTPEENLAKADAYHGTETDGGFVSADHPSSSDQAQVLDPTTMNASRQGTDSECAAVHDEMVISEGYSSPE